MPRSSSPLEKTILTSLNGLQEVEMLIKHLFTLGSGRYTMGIAINICRMNT